MRLLPVPFPHRHVNTECWNIGMMKPFPIIPKQVDMEKWARKHKSTDENLLNFNTYALATFKYYFLQSVL